MSEPGGAPRASAYADASPRANPLPTTTLFDPAAAHQTANQRAAVSRTFEVEMMMSELHASFATLASETEEQLIAACQMMKDDLTQARREMKQMRRDFALGISEEREKNTQARQEFAEKTAVRIAALESRIEATVAACDTQKLDWNDSLVRIRRELQASFTRPEEDRRQVRSIVPAELERQYGLLLARIQSAVGPSSTPNSRSASASSSASSSRSASLDRASMRDRSDDDRDFDRRRARGRDRDPSSRATERALSPVPVEPSATTLARQQLIANEVEAVTRTFSGQQDQVLGDHAHVQQDIHLLRLDLVEVKEVAGRQADGQIRTQNVALAARLKDCQREIKSQTAGLAECQKKLQGVQGSQREHDLPRLCEFQLETADTIKTLEKDITDLQAAQAARASDASKASKRFESQQNFAKEIQDIQSGINRRADAGFQEIEGCVRSLQMEFYEIKLEKEGFDTGRLSCQRCGRTYFLASSKENSCRHHRSGYDDVSASFPCFPSFCFSLTDFLFSPPRFRLAEGSSKVLL
eukprot:m.269032 g.269032  ORF g.269032 m.269032 type:complete len:527 (-) comp54735_c0_seq7:621-2201(-)